MASSLSISFSTHALSRPNCKTGNPRKPLSKKLSKSTPRKQQQTTRTSFHGLSSAPSLSSLPGGEATTYTRLPPKEDFFIPSFDSSSFQSPADVVEVKLSESETANRKSQTNSIELEDDESSGEEEDGEESGFDYGKFELFEVNSDNEGEDGSDYDSDDGEGVKLGFGQGEVVDVFDGEGEEEVKEKEKGVPAVMRCFDRAKIFVKAGDGGNGVVAFRREKFVPFGGPSGGDGGRGGKVYVEVDGSMNSLLPFRQAIHFRAGRGSHGQGSKMNGAKGEDVVIKVAPGTLIRESGKDGVTGEVLMELLYPGQRALLLPGGKGGRGNASFKSGTNKVPRIAEIGEEGAEM